MSGQGDIFRRPWKPMKLEEDESDLPIGYARHVRGVMAPKVRLRPGSARKLHEPQAVSRRARIHAALGAKEVAVKLISHGRGVDSVRRQLRYIGRDGNVPLERSFGEIVANDRDAIDAIADEWALGFHTHGNQARNSVHMMVSAPAGSNRDAVEMAAREFACDLFGANWDYVLARHDDTANPHVHIVAETRGLDGRLFCVEPQDFQQLRERFADHCRQEGIDVTATPRAVRAVTERGEPTGIVKMREEGRAPDRDNRAAAETDGVRERSADERLIAHEAKLNRALAVELRETGRTEDIRAALGLDGLADRADAVLERESGQGGDTALDAIPQREAPDMAASGDDKARRAELAGRDHRAALERLTALRKRKSDELRSGFAGMSGKARAEVIDALRGYERDLDAMYEQMRSPGGSGIAPPGPVDAPRDLGPPKVRSSPAREDRDDDRGDDDGR